MDRASFIEICLHQLKMSGVRANERLIVLTQGDERLDYADAFLAAGRTLGANIYHMRLPAASPMGGWAVGQTSLLTALTATGQAQGDVGVLFVLGHDEAVEDFVLSGFYADQREAIQQAVNALPQAQRSNPPVTVPLTPRASSASTRTSSSRPRRAGPPSRWTPVGASSCGRSPGPAR